MQGLIAPGRSQTQKDALGLRFPKISPKNAAGLKIVSVTVRSTVQYMLKGSNYIVEIAIDREWDTVDTKLPPTIYARVSMYSLSWDEMVRKLTICIYSTRLTR